MREYGPRPSLGELHRATPWVWLWCERCQHHAPLAFAVAVREDLPEQRIVNVGTGEADILADQPNAVGSIGAALSGLLHPDTLP
jgi:hypothetical protein